MKTRPRGRKAFTIVELLMAIALASVIFAGIGSMFAGAFRHELQSIRQQMVQGAATEVLKRMQRDLFEASYLYEPAYPSTVTDGSMLIDGVKHYVNTSANATPSFAAISGKTPERFVYRVCNTNQMHYWKYTGAANVGVSKACGESASIFYRLISPPLQVENVTLTTRRDYNGIEVQFDVVYPTMTAHPEIRMSFQGNFVVHASRCRPSGNAGSGC